MSSLRVERYRLEDGSRLEVVSQGTWVHWSDYQAQKARGDVLEMTLRELQRICLNLDRSGSFTQRDLGILLSRVEDSSIHWEG